MVNRRNVIDLSHHRFNDAASLLTRMGGGGRAPWARGLGFNDAASLLTRMVAVDPAFRAIEFELQ